MEQIRVILMMVCGLNLATSGQECSSSQLQVSLRQVERMLMVHEASYQQNLRSLRRKLSALRNSSRLSSSLTTPPAAPPPAATPPAATPLKNATCPKPEGLANGRRLGRVFAVGHEVHFVCKPGFELQGQQTRVCLEAQRWSGQQPVCKVLNSSNTSLPSLSASDSSNSSSSTSPSSSPSSSPPPPLSAFIRPSRCTHFQGSSHCTCDLGFTISGRDNNICTDLDECELFPLGQQGRLCVFTCVNTPGSFHCVCPRGYNMTSDSRNCKDIDECESGQHNCTPEQLCINTYGGFQCATVECPRVLNASYIKTSPMRCERNPCLVGDETCSQAPNSVSFHFLSVVSNMSAPRVLFRVSAARSLGDTLRFGLVGGRGRSHFSVQRSSQQTGTLLLVSPVQGPATLEAEVEMSELERRALLGRYLTKVTLFVSPYTF